MACNINTGITAINCGITPGGTKKVYVANFTEQIVYTSGTDGSFTNIGFGSSGQVFYEFDLPRTTTIFGSPLAVAGELKSGYNPFVTLISYGFSQQLLNLFNLLNTGKFIVGLVGYDNVQIVFGTGAGMISSAYDMLGAANSTDPRGQTVTLTGLGEITPGVIFTGNFTV